MFKRPTLPRFLTGMFVVGACVSFLANQSSKNAAENLRSWDVPEWIISLITSVPGALLTPQFLGFLAMCACLAWLWEWDPQPRRAPAITQRAETKSPLRFKANPVEFSTFGGVFGETSDVMVVVENTGAKTVDEIGVRLLRYRRVRHSEDSSGVPYVAGLPCGLYSSEGTKEISLAPEIEGAFQLISRDWKDGDVSDAVLLPTHEQRTTLPTEGIYLFTLKANGRDVSPVEGNLLVYVGDSGYSVVWCRGTETDAELLGKIIYPRNSVISEKATN